MSVLATSWAWEHSQATGSAFTVILSLADHAGHDGGDCYPSVARLAVRCRLDERTVQRAIDRLVALGELSIETAGGGRSRSNRYRLLMPDRRTQTVDNPGETPASRHPSDPPKPRQSDRETPASAPKKGGTTPPEPSVEPSGNPPTPNASASGSAVGAPSDASHRGQHPRCRLCGTNPRATAGPPDPLAATQAAARRLMADNAARRAAPAAPPVAPPVARAKIAELRAAIGHAGHDA